ncbi:hypothetical protein BJY01DRAFT_253322 [Aspergillus pseudoustus]|uniref:Uncharacterized protein n=1 Tax=Aspergillus pseudoustus TaxID=1810923 RepID=A0ABR4J1Q1_9EURO
MSARPARVFARPVSRLGFHPVNFRPPFEELIQEMKQLNAGPRQNSRFTLIVKEQSPLGATAAMIMSILGLDYRVDIENVDFDIPCLDVGDRNEHNFIHGKNILTFLIENYDVDCKLSYPAGSQMNDIIRTRVRSLYHLMDHSGVEAGSFVSLFFGLQASGTQWMVARKVTLPDLILMPHIYNLYGQLHVSAIFDPLDDWCDRMLFKPTVRQGMMDVGWEFEYEGYYEELATEWMPRRSNRPQPRQN